MLNHATIAYNSSTSSATIDPSSAVMSGTAGAPFTPTAGNLLVAVCAGPVTCTTPSGWTLPANGSQVSNGGLYVFYKTAAGGDTLTTTNNGTNYHSVVDFYEFASGSTWAGAAGGTGFTNGAAGPTLTGLSGSTNVVVESVENVTSTTAGATTWTFGAGTKVTDVTNDASGGTDGVYYGATSISDYASSSWASPTATSTLTAPSQERIAWAVSVPAGGSTFAVSGTAGAISEVSGQITSRLLASSGAASASEASGAITALLLAAGSVAGASGASGDVLVVVPAVVWPVAGTAAATSLASGGVTQAAVLTASCVPAVKSYLVSTLLPALFPQPIQVTYGMPGSYEAADLVTVGNARVDTERPVMTPTRPIEETVELDVVFSSWRGGGPEAQQTATEVAFTMLATFRGHFKTSSNETLGGACREARVTGYELLEDDDPDDVAKGRLAQIVTTLLVKARN